MSYDVTFQPTGGWWLHQFVGPLTLHDLIQSHLAQVTSPHFQPSDRVLVDLSLANCDALDTADLRTFMDYLKQNPHNARQSSLALIATDDETFGMARVFEQLSDDLDLEINTFRSCPDAVEWLGLSAEQVHHVLQQVRPDTDLCADEQTR